MEDKIHRPRGPQYKGFESSLELLPGSQLLFLLEEHAGIKAKIEFPRLGGPITWRR
jgi:hypothetical protein